METTSSVPSPRNNLYEGTRGYLIKAFASFFLLTMTHIVVTSLPVARIPPAFKFKFLFLFLLGSVLDSMVSVTAEENDSTFAEDKGTEEPLYRCLDLTPDLCPLHREKGQLRIRGINVTYWKFHHDNYDDDMLPETRAFPIVVIHGGPAVAHNYMLPLQQQACRRGRVVYFYDQAGCGASLPDEEKNFSAATDYPWLLEPNYYATVELPALLEHWNLGPKFHILANSWGTILAQLYALNTSTANPDTITAATPATSTTATSTAPKSQLASMVLSGPLSDTQSYLKAQWDQVDGSLGTLPSFLQDRIHALEASKAYNSLEYQSLAKVLTGYFTLRTPAPDCARATTAATNTEIYVSMQGPSEFAMSGVLADFNVTARLSEIQVPVLLSHGKYDTMRPSIVRTMEDALPYVRRLYLERSGHMSMIDEPKRMNDKVADFFDRVEAAWVEDNIPEMFAKTYHDSEEEEEEEEVEATTVSVWILLSSIAFALCAGHVIGEYRERKRLRSKYNLIPELDDQNY